MKFIKKYSYLKESIELYGNLYGAWKSIELY